MIGWELDKMSDEELAEKYEALCRAQIYSDEFPELVTILKSRETICCTGRVSGNFLP